MFGSHLSIAGGMHNALLEAEKLGLQTVQVFTKNQQQWAAKPLDSDAVAAFRREADRLHFTEIVAHDSYLINLAAVDDAQRQRSIAAFTEEMRRCDQLGIRYLVTHPGAHCGQGEPCGLDKVADAFSTIMATQPDHGVVVCIETTAGQGSCLGCRFEHLQYILDRVARPDRMGVCVDTCHLLAAGYDITTAAGTRQVLAEFDRVVGLDRVRVLHLNDSKRELGSHVDRHTHLGHGHVGTDAFAVLVQDSRFRHVPKILETPKDDRPDGREWDAINLDVLRKLERGEPVVIEKPEAPPPKEKASKAPAARAKKAVPRTLPRPAPAKKNPRPAAEKTEPGRAAKKAKGAKNP